MFRFMRRSAQVVRPGHRCLSKACTRILRQAWAEPLENRLLLAAMPIGIEMELLSAASGGFVIAMNERGDIAAVGSSELLIQRRDAVNQVVETRLPWTNRPSAMGMDAAGNLIMVRAYNGADGDGMGVVALRVNASGEPIGSEFVVNTTTAGQQSAPDVAVHPDGSFIVVWTSLTSMHSSLCGQIYNPDGAPVGAELLLTPHSISLYETPAIAMDKQGNFAVSFRLMTYLNARLYDAAGGLRGSLGLNSVIAQTHDIAVDADGDIVLAWDTSTGSVFARHFDSAGQAKGASYQVSTYASQQTLPKVAVNDEGEGVFVWQSGMQDGSGLGIYAQRFSASGARLGSEVRVNTITLDDQRSPQVAMDATGNFTIAWMHQVSASWPVRAQRFEYYSGATVTGFVWNDANGNGVQDAGESGWSAVTVRLHAADGQLVASTNTSATGPYRFDEVRDGRSYYVEITVPSNRTLVRTGQGTDSTLDSDIHPTTRQSPVFALSPHQVLVLDAGLAEPSTVSGTVFRDLDGDGIRGPGETLLSGWIVFADEDGDGQWNPLEPYAISGIHGTYLLKLPPGPALVRLAGQDHWTEGAPRPLELGPKQTLSGVDFACATDVSAVSFAPVGGETRISTPSAFSLSTPVSATDASGGSVVVWAEGSALRARRFDAAGMPRGDELTIKAVGAALRSAPSVAMDASGRFVVTWAQPEPDAPVFSDIHARIFGSDGQPAGDAIRVNTWTDHNQLHPSVAMDDTGRFIIVWQSYRTDESRWSIFGQRYDAAGAPDGVEFRINDSIAASHTHPVVVMSGAGNALVVWQSNGIVARRYDSAGQAVDGVFQVATSSVAGVGYLTAAMNQAGDAVIFWRAGTALNAQRYNAAGLPQGGAQQVSDIAIVERERLAAMLDEEGNATFAWNAISQDGGGWDIVARRWSATGVPKGATFVVNTTRDGDQREPFVGTAADGFVIGWSGADSDGGGIFVQRHVTSAQTGSVAGRVWHDINGNGLQDPDEAGLDDVVVTLLTPAGAQVASILSAGGGGYQFLDVVPGEYVLRFKASGFYWTLANVGDDGTLDSDPDPLTGMTAPFSLAAGEQRTSLDAGALVEPVVWGTVYWDMDLSGAQNGAEPGLRGWIVFLDANGNGMLDPGERSTVSDDDGTFSLSHRPGAYELRLMPQDAWNSASPVPVVLAAGATAMRVDFGLLTGAATRGMTPMNALEQLGTATSHYASSAVAFNADGGYVVVWSTYTALMMQRYTAAGVRQGAAVQVSNGGAWPAVAYDALGHIVVAWDQNGQIYLRRYLADGTPLHSALGVGGGVAPSLSVLSDGRSLVVWRGMDGSGFGIQGRSMTLAGVGAPLRTINSFVSNDQINPWIATDATGNSVIVWMSQGQDGSDNGIYARRVDANLLPIGSEFRVNTTTAGAQLDPAVAMDAQGNFIVVWASQRAVGGYEILAQRYNAAYQPQGGELRISTTVTHSEARPRVAVQPDGSFIVTWTGLDGRRSILARQFNAAAVPLTPEVRVDAFPATDQLRPAVAAGGSNIVITWGSNAGYYAQRYVQPTGNSVSGLAWIDTNGNGLQDPDEVGVDGLKVDLLDADLKLVDSTVTSGGGRYLFPALLAGRTYLVAFVRPTGTVPTFANAGDDARDSDIGTNARTAFFTVPAEPTNWVLDGGFAPASTLSGTLFHDVNGDGVRNAGEGPLVNWQVYIDANGNGQLDAGERSAWTNASGGFTFASLLGLLPYRIRISPPDHWVLTIPADALLVTPGIGGTVSVQVGYRPDLSPTTMIAVGPEQTLSTTTSGPMPTPAIAADAAGNYVVVWDTLGANNTLDIFARRHDYEGRPLGPVFQVNTTTANQQNQPAVASSAAGQFVIVWTSALQDGSGLGVYARLYAADGTPASGEIQLNAHTASDQFRPVVAMDDAGSFVAAWQSMGQDGSGQGVYARRFSAAGVALDAEFRVNHIVSGHQETPAIAMTADGAFAIAWRDAGSLVSVYVSRYSATGEPIGAPLPANTTVLSSSTTDSTAIGMEANGDFIVSWSGTPAGRSDRDVFAQRFNRHGEPIGVEFRVHAVQTNHQNSPAIAVDADGNFVIAWFSDASSGAYPQGVYGQRYNAAGVPVGPEFRISAGTDQVHDRPAIAWGANGHIAVVWSTSKWRVLMQRYEVFTDPASVEGMVWEDVNGNGIRDAGETGRDGVSVTLAGADGAWIGTIITSGGGRYRFDALRPATEYVLQVAAPAGRTFTTYRAGMDDALDSDVNRGIARFITEANSVTTLDAGLVLPGSVSGSVFNDRDGDGVRAPAEEGLSGWLVFLDENGNGVFDAGELSVRTDVGGSYTFLNLPPGTHRLAAMTPPFWTLSTMPAALEVQLALAENRVNANMGHIDAAPITPFSPVGPRHAVNAAGEKVQWDTRVAIDDDGNHVMIWDARGASVAERLGLYGQRFNRDGQPLGSWFRIDSPSSTHIVTGEIAMNGAGRFVVIWRGATGIDTSASFARLYDEHAQPLGEAFQIDNGASNKVAMAADGSFIVSWREIGTSSFEIWVQRYDVDGQKIGGAFRVNTNVAGTQYPHRILPQADGGLILVWEHGGLLMRRFDADGNPVSAETRISTQPWRSDVGFDASGGYAVTWYEEAPDGRGFNVMVQRFDAGGSALWGPVRVNAAEPSFCPQIAMRPDGSFVLTYFTSYLYAPWVSTPEWTLAYVRYFTAAGVPGPELVASDRGVTYPQIVASDTGRIAVAWGGHVGAVQRYDLGAGDDVLVLDLSPGQLIPAGGMTFDGGEGMDRLRIIGAQQVLYQADGTLLVDGQRVRLISIEVLEVGPGQGITVVGGGELTIDADAPGTHRIEGASGAESWTTPLLLADSIQIVDLEESARIAVRGHGAVVLPNGGSLESLQLSDHARATLPAGRGVLLMRRIAITGAAFLDLADNDLVLRSDLEAGALPLLGDLLRIGRGRQAGIHSSCASGAVGLVPLYNAGDDGQPMIADLGGHTLRGTDWIVRFGLIGDLDLNDRIDGDDYFEMDRAYLMGVSGFSRADLSLDRRVDAADYFLLDRALLHQSAGQAEGGSMFAVAGMLSKASEPPAQENEQTRPHRDLLDLRNEVL